MEYKMLYCPICKHSWMSKIIKEKTYYQCPKCKHQNKIESFEEKDKSLNGEE